MAGFFTVGHARCSQGPRPRASGGHCRVRGCSDCRRAPPRVPLVRFRQSLSSVSHGPGDASWWASEGGGGSCSSKSRRARNRGPEFRWHCPKSRGASGQSCHGARSEQGQLGAIKRRHDGLCIVSGSSGCVESHCDLPSGSRPPRREHVASSMCEPHVDGCRSRNRERPI